MGTPFTEMENKLVSLGIDRAAIAINEPARDGQYTIHFDGSKTEVFLFERGIKHSLKTFDLTSDAINYFVEWVLSEPGNRVGF